jgi:flavin-dependent dehydrogenase
MIGMGGSLGIRLKDGDQVCIVGGGPAGSFAALHLLRLARQANLNLKVLIFERRDFSQPGPAGCNHCAGVLSSRVLQGLQALGLGLPADVIQATITSYKVYLDGGPASVEQPGPGRSIVSVYRGGGPRFSPMGPVASFDRFLVDQAVERGAQLIPHFVRKIVWEDRPIINVSKRSYPADLLVLATGVNTRSPLDRAFNYEPPPIQVMAQDEVLRPLDWNDSCVSVYFRNPPSLIFGALVPKGDYLNISLLGHNLSTEAVPEFLEAQRLAASMRTGSLCGCTSRIAVGSARGFCGDRWVAVGDAAVTHLYKDGIGSAYHTAERAMQVAVGQGISAADFRRGYLPFCRSVARDNFFGQILFKLWGFTLRTSPLLQAWRRAMESEAGLRPDKRIHSRVLWGMLSGGEAYRKLFRLAVSPRAGIGVLRELRRARD